jgi:D-xylose 1-dehydrogenase (NADP+, D-xylono-1,5-lactone-forming)
VPRSFGSYDQLLVCDDVDVLCIPLPIALHPQWTITARQAGKHMLYEKRFVTIAANAAACFDVGGCASGA